jgi:hypothetical protein
MGKTFKYSFWMASALFFYHLWAVTYTDEPDKTFGVNEVFLTAAHNAKVTFEDLSSIMTRPAVDTLLLPRPPLPAGYMPMKVLVLGLSGNLIHTEYKLGVGFEVQKRPGLSVFLQRMARNYEVVIFGDQE